MNNILLDRDVEDLDRAYGEEIVNYYDAETDDVVDAYAEDDDYSEELAEADTTLSPDELEELDTAEAEILAELDPDMFDDSAELAETFREVLHDDYRDALSEEIEEALFNVLESMTPAEGFNFSNALRQIGTAGQKVLQDPTVGQVAGTVLPAAGAAIGTVYGGPVGTAVGGKLGQVAAQGFSGGRKPSGASATSKPATGSLAPGPTDAGGSGVPGTSAAAGGSTAAAQLLQLTQNPDVLKSLLALALGSHGQTSIPVGPNGTAVPVGAVTNLLSTLSSKAAVDAETLAGESENTSAYLLDSEGVFRVDPAVDEDRAQALYETLLAAEEQRLYPEQATKAWSDFFPFAKGTKLLIEYETWMRNLDIGQAIVIERTSNFLKLNIHIDKSDSFSVPETNAMIKVEYRNEGPGNGAAVVVNGSKFNDDDVTVRSTGNARQISMSITIFGQTVDRITLSREDSDEAKLKFQAAGDEHVLILTKK